MSPYTAPRFFTEQDRRPIKGKTEPLHALDRFRLSRGSQSPVDCCVILNDNGYLEVRDLNGTQALPNNLLNQLAFDEIAAGGKLREIDVYSLHLLNVQMMEQPVNTIGLNDPIILHGTLSKAFGAAEETLIGNLMVTRADFLNAIIAGAEYAFQYSISGVEGMAARCFPLLLAGSRTESTFRGLDLVLAYPLLPTDIIDKTPGNETLIQQMLYEVLSTLKDDLDAQDVQNPLCSEDLSALDRARLEQELTEKGYVIDGDRAYRKKNPTQWQPLSEFIERLAPLFRKEVHLPYKHTLDDLLTLSSEAFTKMEEWPPPSTVAIRSRCRRSP